MPYFVQIKNDTFSMTSSFWVFLSEYPGNYTAIDGKLLLVYACEKIRKIWASVIKNTKIVTFFWPGIYNIKKFEKF